MMMQRRPLKQSRLSTSHTSTAMGKSLPGNAVGKSALFGAPQTFSNTSTATRSFLALLLQRLPSVVPQTLQLTTPPNNWKSLAGNVVAKAPSTVLHAQQPHRSPQQWVKACLAGCNKERPLWCSQGCGSGSGSVLDPYSIGSVDPDPYSESGSGSRRAKMTHKSRQ